jgi:hypothetical protein
MVVHRGECEMRRVGRRGEQALVSMAEDQLATLAYSVVRLSATAVSASSAHCRISTRAGARSSKAGSM